VSKCLAVLPVLLLAGCTAGPDYHVPDHALVNAPTATGAFAGGGEKGFAPSAELPDRWWRLYDDPLLDGLVTQALAANTDLRAADANLRAATAVVREAEAGRTVQTTLEGGAALARPYGTGGGLPGTVGYDLGGSIAYPLDLAGQIRRGIEAARADAEANRAARDYMRVSVAAAVTRSYAAACAANVRLAAADRVLTLQRQTFDATRRLAKGGRGTAFDVTRAQTAVEENEATLPAFVAARKAALYELAALMGRPPADNPRAVEACDALPRIAQPLPIGDGAALLRRRPDVRAAERQLAAATARIGVATASLYPQVSLGGSAGFTGPAATIGSDKAFHVSLGPLVSWTFPNRAIARAQIAQAGAAADSALAGFDGTVIEALRQTETALSTYARTQDEVAALSQARDSAAKAGRQAGKLFRYGRAGFLDLLTAQSALASAESGLAAAQTALVDDQVSLFLALGGGWRVDEIRASPASAANPAPTDAAAR
jgi:multidrug efflux system outer membrane protein